MNLGAAFIAAAVLFTGFQGEPPPKLRELAQGEMSSAQESMVAALLSSPEFYSVAMRLSRSPNVGLVDRLETLTSGEEASTRERAALVLALIPNKRTLSAALKVAVADPQVGTRRAVASALGLHGNPRLLGQAELLKDCKSGLADKDADVSFSFALLLQKAGDESGVPLLKKALKHRDHHRRETAAESLAELGDDSGVGVLIKMIQYTTKNHPLLRANSDQRKDPEAWAGLVAMVHEEQIRVCGHLGRLKSKKALSALRKLASSKSSPVPLKEAAERAASEIDGG